MEDYQEMFVTTRVQLKENPKNTIESHSEKEIVSLISLVSSQNESESESQKEKKYPKSILKNFTPIQIKPPPLEDDD